MQKSINNNTKLKKNNTNNGLSTINSLDISTTEFKQHKELNRLQKLVSDLEKELATQLTPQPQFQDGEVERLFWAIDSLEKVANQILDLATELKAALKQVTDTKIVSLDKQETPSAEATKLQGYRMAPATLDEPINSPPSPSAKKQQQLNKNVKSDSLALTTCASKDSQNLTSSQQKILDALVEIQGLGLNKIQRPNLAVFSGQSPKSSAFTNNLGRLKSLGLIDYPSGGYVAITKAGQLIAKPPDHFRSLQQFHSAWYSKLTSSQAKILQALIRRYPDAIERFDLALEAGQSPTSSAYTNNLGYLRSLRLIDYPIPKRVRATKLLFPPVTFLR